MFLSKKSFGFLKKGINLIFMFLTADFLHVCQGLELEHVFNWSDKISELLKLVVCFRILNKTSDLVKECVWVCGADSQFAWLRFSPGFPHQTHDFSCSWPKWIFYSKNYCTITKYGIKRVCGQHTDNLVCHQSWSLDIKCYCVLPRCHCKLTVAHLN